MNKIMNYLLAITFLLSPTYLVKFNLFGIPLNLLMVWVFVVWGLVAIWFIKYNKAKDFINWLFKINKFLLAGVALLFIAASISLVYEGISLAKLGQYLVLFIQPVSLFFLFGFINFSNPKSKNIFIYAVYIFLFVSGIYAVAQYCTLIGLPPAWWGNSIEPKRALTFFAHPDFFALFTTPLLGLLLPDVSKKLFEVWKKKTNFIFVVAWFSGVIGLIFSLSRGGWMGFLAACLVFVILAGKKKYFISAGFVLIIAAGIIYYLPLLRYRIILPFHGQRSALERLIVWDAGIEMVKDSPILGEGLSGYAKNFPSYSNGQTSEKHNYPHLIFLTFWVETGLLGLLGFILTCAYIFYVGIYKRGEVLRFGVLIFLVALLSHGLVDNPYFKNDLALVFWIVLSLIL